MQRGVLWWCMWYPTFHVWGIVRSFRFRGGGAWILLKGNGDVLDQYIAGHKSSLELDKRNMLSSLGSNFTTEILGMCIVEVPNSFVIKILDACIWDSYKTKILKQPRPNVQKGLLSPLVFYIKFVSNTFSLSSNNSCSTYIVSI